MFDFLRDLTKSEEEKRREAAAAYLDGFLSARESAHFEDQLKHDSALADELANQRWVRQQLSALPEVKAPRSYTLDPARFGRPSRQISYRIYPALRTATVVAAILFVFLFAVNQFAELDMGREETTITAAEGQSAAENESLPTPIVKIEESSPAREELVEEVLEEQPVETFEGLFAAPPEETELEAPVEPEGEVEVAQPVVEEEVAPEEEQAEERPQPERLPSEITDGTPPAIAGSDSTSDEDAYVAPETPSEAVLDLAQATLTPAETQVPANTEAAAEAAVEEEQAAEASVSDEEAAELVTAEEVGKAAAQLLSPETRQTAAAQSAAEAGEAEPPASEETQVLSRRGFFATTSAVTIVELFLGIAFLTLFAATILLRRRIR